MKKVVIVEPTSSSANVFSFFSYLPLMGPMYLGTILNNDGFDVSVYNENILKRDLTDKELSSDFLLLSCLTPTVTKGFQIAKRYRKLNPNGKIIMGGPHVSFVKDDELDLVDHIVIGEGENVISDLIKYGSDEKFIHGSPVTNLDTLPFIDWNLLHGHKKGNIMPIMTSRGCPFACNFCSVAEMFGRKYRAMSADRVAEEVKLSTKRFIFFYDDNFTADLNRAHEIMDRMIDMGVRPKTWTAQIRSDIRKDPELVRKMRSSGCDRVYIGFESINLNTLKGLKKSQTPEDIREAIQTLHINNIKVHGMFMYGSDSDDPSVIVETNRFVRQTRIDSVQYMVLTPLPGTELFNRLENEGRLIHRNWENYDGLHVVFWPEKFSPFDLQRLAIESFKKFYSLSSASNEMLNLLGQKISDNFGLLKNKGLVHTFSLKNAVLKAGGKLILNRWQKINESYMNYLKQLGTAVKFTK